METALATGLPLWAIDLFLAGLVYSRQPRHWSNRTFAAFAVTIVAWSVSVKMVYVYAASPAGLFWGRLAFATASLIGSSFIVFCHVFPDRKRLQLSQPTLYLTLVGVVVACLSLTPLVLRQVVSVNPEHIQASYGPLYQLFGVFMLTAFGQGFWTLTRKWRASRGRSRLQIQYLWLGICLLLGAGLTTNLIVPALTGSSRLGAYGPYFMLFLVGFTTHAIIRHRLMDMRVVIRQSATYGLSAGVAVGIMWGLLIVIDKGFGVKYQSSSAFLSLMIGGAGAIVFHPVRTIIQYLLDRYCYRQEYDYRQAIRNISQVLASLLHIDPLCESLTVFILNTLKVEEVAVYLCHERSFIEQRSYQHVSDGEQGQTRALTMVSPSLMTLLERARQPILQDELTLWTDVSEQAHLHEEFMLLRGKCSSPCSLSRRLPASSRLAKNVQAIRSSPRISNF